MNLFDYTEIDISNMLHALNWAMHNAKDNCDEQLWKDLIKVSDFLERLLQESRKQ